MHCAFYDQRLRGQSNGNGDPPARMRFFAEMLCADERFCYCFEAASSSEEDYGEDDGEDGQRHDNEGGWNMSALIMEQQS